MELIGCISDIDDDRDVDDEYGFDEEYDFNGVVSIVGLFVRAKLTDSAQYIAIYIAPQQQQLLLVKLKMVQQNCGCEF